MPSNLRPNDQPPCLADLAPGGDCKIVAHNYTIKQRVQIVNLLSKNVCSKSRSVDELVGSTCSHRGRVRKLNNVLPTFLERLKPTLKG